MKSDKAYEPEQSCSCVTTASGCDCSLAPAGVGREHRLFAHGWNTSSCAGRGLGLQASLAALHRMPQRAGQRQFCKPTISDPAIKIYLKLGFSPVIVHESQPALEGCVQR